MSQPTDTSTRGKLDRLRKEVYTLREFAHAIMIQRTASYSNDETPADAERRRGIARQAEQVEWVADALGRMTNELVGMVARADAPKPEPDCDHLIDDPSCPFCRKRQPTGAP